MRQTCSISSEHIKKGNIGNYYEWLYLQHACPVKVHSNHLQCYGQTTACPDYVCSNPMQLCTHSKLVLDFTLIWNVTFVLYLCTSTCNETIQFCSYVVEVITTMLNAMSYMSYIVAPQYISLLYSETMSELTLLTIDNSKHICDSNRQCSTFNLQEPWQVKWKQGRN